MSDLAGLAFSPSEKRIITALAYAWTTPLFLSLATKLYRIVRARVSTNATRPGPVN